MHARVVRFTGVTPERISEIVARIEDEDGPPPGVDPVGFELFVDGAQGTALFVGYFETEEKMREASAVFEQMDSSETPGSRPPSTCARSKCSRGSARAPRRLPSGGTGTRPSTARTAHWHCDPASNSQEIAGATSVLA